MSLWLSHIYIFGFAVSYTISETYANEPPEKPNILLIVTDDQGYNDAGFQGSQDIKTPNLDKLAQNGIVFTDAHVTATVCSPSRAGLMTGRYQQRFGHESNNPPADLGMDTSEITIADVLRDNGYRTAVIGKWHLGEKDQYHPNSRGFDYFYGFLGGSRSYFPMNYGPGNPRAIMENMEYVPLKEGYLTDVQADSTISFINRSGNDPFFVFLSFLAPHTPMEAKKEDLDLFEGHPRQEYAAMMWAMDRAVGSVIETLEEQDKLDNTLIFFLSDNGGAYFNDSNNKPLKGGKGNKFEAGHRVPFFITWNSMIDGGRYYDGLTSSMDIFPTAIAAAGIENELERPLDGVNLLPYLASNKEKEPHRKIYFRKGESAAMREGKWKLIRQDAYGYVMYNLENDLGETNNLIQEYNVRFQSMKSDLENWETHLKEPWWQESQDWLNVIKHMHISLMKNKEIKKLRP